MAQKLRVNETTGGSGAQLDVTIKGNIPNAEPNNTLFKFGQAYRSFSPESYVRENGSSSSLIPKDQVALDSLRALSGASNIQTPSVNHNNIMSMNSTQLKMAASSSITQGVGSGGLNTNGFQLPLSSTPELQTKTQGPGLSMSPKIHLNSQLSSVLDQGSSRLHSPTLTPSSPRLNPSSMKFMNSGPVQPQSVVPQQNQFNQQNANRQEILQRSSFNSGLINQEFPVAPRGTTSVEQYGGSQQRFMSASNEHQFRGTSSRTSSPFHSSYFPQEVNNSNTSHRTGNLQSDERNLMTNSSYWNTSHRNQTAYCSPNIPSNTNATQAMNRNTIQVRKLSDILV